MTEKLSFIFILFIDLIENDKNSVYILGDYSICINKINDSSVIRDGREKLEKVCYKIPMLSMKRYSLLWKWTSISFKCVLQNLGQPLNVFLRSKWFPNRGENMES